MGAADLPIAYMNGRDYDFLRRKAVQQQAHGGNVCHSVQRTHLMKVNFRRRNAVGMALGLCNQAVNRQDIRLDAFRETQVIPDDVFNVMKAAVVVVVPVMVFVIVAGMVMVMSVTMFMAVRMAVGMLVGMVVALLLHAVHFYGKMGPGNAALHRRFPRNGNAGKV